VNVFKYVEGRGKIKNPKADLLPQSNVICELLRGLKKLEGQKIVLLKHKNDYPDRYRLAKRYEEYGRPEKYNDNE
jgi:hypothetical protein